jgi:hypothetical protein
MGLMGDTGFFDKILSTITRGLVLGEQLAYNCDP